MFLRHWLGLALLVSGAACGRVGVELLRLDSSSTSPPAERDASVRDGSADLLDARVPADGGLLEDNIPLDASMPVDAGRDASVDAGQDASMDAGRDASMDAGRDASMGQDASTDAGPDASQPTVCGGDLVFGLCWYLAGASESCNDECSDKGGFDARSVQYVGTPDQGGSVEECTAIMTALGRPGSVVVAMRSDDYGFGCHLWTDGTTYWLIAPRFRPSVAAPSQGTVRIVCGCMR